MSLEKKNEKSNTTLALATGFITFSESRTRRLHVIVVAVVWTPVRVFNDRLPSEQTVTCRSYANENVDRRCRCKERRNCLVHPVAVPKGRSRTGSVNNNISQSLFAKHVECCQTEGQARFPTWPIGANGTVFGHSPVCTRADPTSDRNPMRSGEKF